MKQEIICYYENKSVCTKASKSYILKNHFNQTELTELTEHTTHSPVYYDAKACTGGRKNISIMLLISSFCIEIPPIEPKKYAVKPNLSTPSSWISIVVVTVRVK